jgi:hypothetical protein
MLSTVGLGRFDFQRITWHLVHHVPCTNLGPEREPLIVVLWRYLESDSEFSEFVTFDLYRFDTIRLVHQSLLIRDDLDFVPLLLNQPHLAQEGANTPEPWPWTAQSRKWRGQAP